MKLSDKLINWYNENKRNLPWRNTNNPYAIWISEIILQQTRVNQGLGYYDRFLKRFPTIKELADADEEEVLRLWQGLGYYSRARNLHNTARTIVDQYEGKFPDTYDEIIKLKGIGDYTASAVLSIAFNKAYPVVDGNVLRVLTRIFAVSEDINSSSGKKKVYEVATQHINPHDPGTYNQAIMEFGALYCVPVSPDCENCIFREDCVAYKKNRVSDFPVKKAKKASRKRYFNYLVFVDHSDHLPHALLHKRTGNDIWRHLYEFPLIETETLVGKNKLEGLLSEKFSIEISLKNISPVRYKHILTHQEITCTFYLITFNSSPHFVNKYLRIPFSKLNEYPISRLVEKYLQDHLYKL